MPETVTPPATPAAPTPVPTPPPSAPAPTEPRATDDAGNGFPAETPVAQMEPAEQAAYWRHQARKHEARASGRQDYDAIKAERDELKQAGESASEKAVREAREAGKAEARSENTNGTVAAMIRIGLSGRLNGDALTEALADVDTINLSALVDDKGLVNDERVLRTINRLAGTANTSTTTQGPDTGQGNRGKGASRTGSVAQIMADRAAARVAK